jgi:hypothetical protein
MGHTPSLWKLTSSLRLEAEGFTARVDKTVDTGPILTAFGGSMARKEAERNIRYG